MAIKINSKSKVQSNFDYEKTIENLERVFLSGEDNVFRDDAFIDSICRNDVEPVIKTIIERL